MRMIRNVIRAFVLEHSAYMRACQDINMIMKEYNGKKILLVGEMREVRFLEKKLQKRKIYPMVCSSSDGISAMKSKIDVLELDYCYIFVVMSHLLRKEISMLADCGVALKSIHYIYRGATKFDVNLQKDAWDVQKGFGRRDDCGGYTIWGDVDNAKHIICVLGNSTSDSKFLFIKSWPEMLYEQFKKRGNDICVVDGAMMGHNSSQEVLSCIRDLIHKKPDFIITLSGVLNIDANYENKLVKCHPYIWEYQRKLVEKAILHKRLWMQKKYKQRINEVIYGLKDDRPFTQWWVDDMRLMHAVCNEFGIKFISFLQPNMFAGTYKINGSEHFPTDSNYQKRVYDWHNKVREIIKNYDYIYDFSELYAGMEDIFWDTVHVYEKGNRIMAKAIYEIIEGEIH